MSDMRVDSQLASEGGEGNFGSDSVAVEVSGKDANHEEGGGHRRNGFVATNAAFADDDDMNGAKSVNNDDDGRECPRNSDETETELQRNTSDRDTNKTRSSSVSSAASFTSHDKSRRCSVDLIQNSVVREEDFGSSLLKSRTLNCVLNISHLTRNTSEDHLHEIFGEFGEVKSVEISTDRQGQINRGNAYVEFSSRDQAENAQKSLEGGQIDGQRIKVDFLLLPSDTTPRTEKVLDSGGFRSDAPQHNARNFQTPRPRLRSPYRYLGGPRQQYERNPQWSGFRRAGNNRFYQHPSGPNRGGSRSPMARRIPRNPHTRSPAPCIHPQRMSPPSSRRGADEDHQMSHYRDRRRQTRSRSHTSIPQRLRSPSPPHRNQHQDLRRDRVGRKIGARRDADGGSHYRSRADTSQNRYQRPRSRSHSKSLDGRTRREARQHRTSDGERRKQSIGRRSPSAHKVRRSSSSSSGAARGRDVSRQPYRRRESAPTSHPMPQHNDHKRFNRRNRRSPSRELSPQGRQPHNSKEGTQIQTHRGSPQRHYSSARKGHHPRRNRDSSASLSSEPYDGRRNVKNNTRRRRRSESGSRSSVVSKNHRSPSLNKSNKGRVASPSRSLSSSSSRSRSRSRSSSRSASSS